MISIIIPFYNASGFLSEAIESVINQTHHDWELILINDGSTDESKKIATSFNDSRIRYYEQKNKGVSGARNKGLKEVKGNYFCFLDADDVMPKNSLLNRMNVFKSNPDTSFVDGKVIKMDLKLNVIEAIWTPSFFGNPFTDLIHLTRKSFFGPTWMIKSELISANHLVEGLTHGEELLFYMNLSKKSGTYSFTEEPILYYRNNPNSAMKNLKALEKGYRFIESQIKCWPEVGKSDLRIFRCKYKRAMTLAYLRKKSIQEAFKVWY